MTRPATDAASQRRAATGLPAGAVPKHVALVMDGNGRWAKQRGLPRTEGHKRGEAALFDVVEGAIEIGVTHLSAYAFSTENWKRSPDEVRFLMGFNRDVIRRRRDDMHSLGVRVRWAGRRPRLWRSVIKELEVAEQLTAANRVLTLTMCVNYGGRAEIADAAKAIAIEAAAGRIDPAKVDERMLARYLDEPDMPDVDMFLRPSGEQRTSNFLIWQSAYAELVFQDTLFPDFDRRDLWRACEVYASRQRRFGGVIDRCRRRRPGWSDDDRDTLAGRPDAEAPPARPPQLRPAPHAARPAKPGYRPGSLEIFGAILLLAIVFRGPLESFLGHPVMQSWSTVFVAICVQATPFLVLGVVVSGAIAAFVPPRVFSRIMPSNAGTGGAGGRHLRCGPARLRMRVGADLEPVDRTRGPAVRVTGLHAVGAGDQSDRADRDRGGVHQRPVDGLGQADCRAADRGDRRVDLGADRSAGMDETAGAGVGRRPVGLAGVPVHHPGRLHPGRRLPGDRRRRRGDVQDHRARRTSWRASGRHWCCPSR